MQHTLANDLVFTGKGLHSGAAVTMRLRPAAADTGIVFLRTDIGRGERRIPALWNNVTDTRLSTTLSNRDGAHISTVEHIMAALRGCGIDNALIEVSGPEIPVMDGSAADFCEGIEDTGLLSQSLPRRAIQILKPVMLERETMRAGLVPAVGSSFEVEIDFDHSAIGYQTYRAELYNGRFAHDLAPARTFGFLHEVNALRAQGLARGGSLENAVVLDDNGVMNEEGLRFADEFARHKVLDSIGDLYLAGGPILGAFKGMRPGHALNNALLRTVFADPECWRQVDLYTDMDFSRHAKSRTRNNAPAPAPETVGVPG